MTFGARNIDRAPDVFTVKSMDLLEICMAKYYAIIKNGYIQKDMDRDQLEIYETEEAARKERRTGATVIKVDVKKSND